MNYIIALAVLVGLGLYLRSRYKFWQREGLKLQQSGYMPPEPSWIARFFFALATRLLVFMVVGPVKVRGRKHARVDGRLAVGPNHQFAMDFAVVRVALPCHYWQIAKAKEVTGVRAAPAAWFGTVAVDVEGGVAQKRGIGEIVIKAGAKILARARRARLLLFPQGKLEFDNILRPEAFRTGLVRTLQLAATIVDGDTLSVLPMAIRYRRDPSQATWFHRLVRAVGFKSFRTWKDRDNDGNKLVFTNYGADVLIGEPIPFASLPADARQATEVVRAAIQALLDELENSTKKTKS